MSLIQLHTVATLRASRRDRFFLFFVWVAASSILFCASSISAFRLRTEGSFKKVASLVKCLGKLFQHHRLSEQCFQECIQQFGVFCFLDPYFYYDGAFSLSCVVTM